MQLSLIILLLIFEMTKCSYFDFYTNRCDRFTGQKPGTFLDQCPQAKFMEREDYECYDEAYKNE